MANARTFEECDKIMAGPHGHEPGALTGCPMGRGGIYIDGGSGDDTVIIANSDQDVDAAIARWESEKSVGPSSTGTVADGSKAIRPAASEDKSVELAVIGLFVIVAAFFFVIKLLGRGDA